MSTCIHREGCADHHRCKAADRCLALRKDADVGRLTFSEWFKREYPLYEREGVSRDTSLKAALRIAWETAERQSLSQEAVRDEVLAAAMKACGRHLYGTDEFRHGVRTCIEAIRALKREPNAAAQGGPTASHSVAGTGHAGQASPAPAAPDVASMVKRLNDISEGREGRIAHIFKDCREAAALLAKLGQGWIPVSERLPEGDGQVLVTYNTGGADVLTRQAVRNLYEAAEIEGDGECFITHWMPLPPAPGASDD